MVEEKRVSSFVNYRWLRGSECERNRNWDSGQQERKAQLGEKQNAIWEKNVFVYVCLSWKRRKAKEGNEKEKSKQEGKKTAFANDLHWKISFRRQNKDHFPINETIQVFVLSVVAYILRAMCKNEARGGKRGKKVLALNFSASVSTHPFGQADVSSNACGPPVLSPLGLRLKLNLVRLSDKDFAIGKAEGKQEVGEVDH